ncbi:hypothetical protein CDAR_454621 [Caerostris darwini]|uniref:Uncharacterized protein n=1 Tax=Caerostris darwini TaxID=1538125 RepID=A0AAV4TVN1_9ARAC|nr:hypothetical protein CDAR_454621 [Caerostris darwini]
MTVLSTACAKSHLSSFHGRIPHWVAFVFWNAGQEFNSISRLCFCVQEIFLRENSGMEKSSSPSSPEKRMESGVRVANDPTSVDVRNGSKYNQYIMIVLYPLRVLNHIFPSFRGRIPHWVAFVFWNAGRNLSQYLDCAFASRKFFWEKIREWKNQVPLSSPSSPEKRMESGVRVA